MKNTKKALLAVLACSAVFAGAFGLAACDGDKGGDDVEPQHVHHYVGTPNNDGTHNATCNETKGTCDTPTITNGTCDTDGTDGACSVCGYKAPEVHTHVWSWTVANDDKPSAENPGKATRTCTGTVGECDWTEDDLETPLPILDDEGYTVGDDSATCSAEGTQRYSIEKDGKIASFEIDTPINANAHVNLEHKEREFTCADGGTAEHWACNDCGKLFDSEECETELTESDVNLPVGHKITLEINKETGTVVEACQNEGCTLAAKEYKLIDADTIGTQEAPTAVTFGDYYIDLEGSTEVYLKLDLTEDKVYEFNFEFLNAGNFVLQQVSLDDLSDSTKRIAYGARAAAVLDAYKKIATVVHGGSGQTTVFSVDAAGLKATMTETEAAESHSIIMKCAVQNSPKVKMTVKEGNPKLIEGENTVEITDTYAFVDNYYFVSATAKKYAMTVPAGVEVLMNDEDFIFGDDNAVNFEAAKDEIITFTFKNATVGNITVTIGEPLAEAPKLTVETPLTAQTLTGHAVTVFEVGDIEAGKYTLTVNLPMSFMNCFGYFGKNISENYDDYFEANGNTVAGSPAEVSIQFPNANVLNSETIYSASLTMQRVLTITLDLKKGDKLVFVHAANNATVDISIAAA